jgi:multidrug efflux pump subunit AcrB
MAVGIAVSNSILLVNFANDLRIENNSDPVSAALEAGKTRLRPVLMTALAMIIGMAPMALSADQNAPLGRAVIGGLLFATCNTLLLVPVVFSLVHGRENQRAEPRQGIEAGTA